MKNKMLLLILVSRKKTKLVALIPLCFMTGMAMAGGK